MWSKGEVKAVLDAKALARKGATTEAEEAALLYARWQGLTEEEGIDSQAAKVALDALIDGMEPEDWDGINSVARNLGDATFKGVLTYAVDRVAQQNAEEIRRLEAGRSTDSDRDY